MRLVLPVSSSDVHLLPFFVGVLRHLGPIRGHEVTLIPSPSVVPQASQAAQDLEMLAPGHVQVVPLNEDPVGGWPLAPNKHFKETVGILDRMKNQLPWFWCELDQTPLVPGWLDALENEYQQALAEFGKLFMGTIAPTRMIGPDGVVIQDHPEYGPHMVGSGIYHPRFSSLVGWAYPSIMVSKPETAQVVAFDIGMRDEIRPKCHDSKLMQHMWSTVNYHQNGVGIVCEDGPKNPYGTSHCGMIRPGVVVVHGCKDGSLAKLVMERDFSKDSGVEQPVARQAHNLEVSGSNPVSATPALVPVSATQPSEVSPGDRLAALERRMEALEAKVARFVAGNPQDVEDDPMAQALMASLEQVDQQERVERAKDATPQLPKEKNWTKKSDKQPETAPESSESPSDVQKVVSLLTTSPKAMRISVVSEHTGLDRNALIALAGAEDCPFTASGTPAVWLKMKVAVSA